MKNWFTDNFRLMILSSILFIGGYLFLRLAYHMTDSMPFTQEIILIVLGTIATILITALLLNKQTSVELEKEQSVKFIELKTETYQNLINTIEEIVQAEKIDELILTKLRFHTHRLAIFASPAVLKEYRNFLNIFEERVVVDKEVSGKDADIISQAKLTIYIRADLIGELDRVEDKANEEIFKQIIQNKKE